MSEISASGCCLGLYGSLARSKIATQTQVSDARETWLEVACLTLRSVLGWGRSEFALVLESIRQHHNQRHVSVQRSTTAVTRPSTSTSCRPITNQLSGFGTTPHAAGRSIEDNDGSKFGSVFHWRSALWPLQEKAAGKGAVAISHTACVLIMPPPGSVSSCSRPRICTARSKCVTLHSCFVSKSLLNILRRYSRNA